MGGGGPLSPPPAPPDGLGADDGWFDMSPSDDCLVGAVMEGLFNELLNEPLEPYGISVPASAPPIREAWIEEVVASEATLIRDFVDDHDGDTLSNVTMQGDLRLAGQLDLADAIAAEAAGTARRLNPGSTDPVVDVVLSDHHVLEIEAGILHESLAELADLQEVFSRSWVDEE
jgi:hypothetical protein